MKSKNPLVMDFKHFYICRPCASARGGTIPEKSVVTAHESKCPYCKVLSVCIPHVDFNWPNGKKAIFD